MIEHNTRTPGNYKLRVTFTRWALEYPNILCTYLGRTRLVIPQLTPRDREEQPARLDVVVGDVMNRVKALIPGGLDPTMDIPTGGD